MGLFIVFVLIPTTLYCSMGYNCMLTCYLLKKNTDIMDAICWPIVLPVMVSRSVEDIFIKYEKELNKEL